MIHQYGKGTALACIGTLFYALLGISIKLAGNNADMWQIMIGRGLVGAVAMLILAHVMGVPLFAGKPTARLIPAIANFAAAAFITIALMVIPIFEALVLWYIFPVWTTLLSWKLLGEPLSFVVGGLIALAMLGVVIMLWPSAGVETTGLHWGHIAGLLSSFCAATAFVSMRVYSNLHGVAHFFNFCVFSLIASLIPMLIFSSPVIPSVAGLEGIFYVALAGCLGQVLIYSAIIYIPPANVAVITTGEIFIAAIIAMLFLGEVLTVQMVVGGLLVIFAALALTLYQNYQKKRNQPSRVE